MSNLPSGCSISDIPGNRPEDELNERAEELVGEDMDSVCADSIEQCEWALFLGNDVDREHPCGCFYDIIEIQDPLERRGRAVYKVAKGDPHSCPFFDGAVERQVSDLRGW